MSSITSDTQISCQNETPDSPENRITGSSKRDEPCTIPQFPDHQDDIALSSDEPLQARLERLGRERPPIFTNWIREALFVFSITMSQFLTEFFVSGFTVILPIVIRKLDIPQASSVWPATAFSLVVGSTLLVFGRLGDMWGGSVVFLGGLAWFIIWTVVAGFSTSPLMLDICRALQGLGAAAFLPSGIMMMGSIYRPGPRKNLVFAIYGTLAVFGFFGGIFVAGLVGQFLHWGFYFWIGGILACITFVTSIFSVPRSKTACADISMDYLGALTIVSGLTLTFFALTQSAHAPLGWKTPYVPICLGLGLLFLGLAAVIEARFAPDPLLPSFVFKTPAMSPLIISLFFLYGTWGIFSVYGTLYFQYIMGAEPLQVVAWYVPLGLAGLIISVLEGFILHLVPGKILLVVSGLGALGSQLLLAFIPGSTANYWAWIFPATVLSTIGIDLSTILATVFITTTFPVARQGLAGGVINSVLQLGVAFCLGISDIIQTATVSEKGLAESYKNTFWFGVASAALSLLVLTFWGKVPKAVADLTADEKRQLMKAANDELAKQPRA